MTGKCLECLKNAFESSMLTYYLMLLWYGIFITKMVLTRKDKDEIIALLADQLNDFKNKVTEEIKRNIFDLLKEDNTCWQFKSTKHPTSGKMFREREPNR